MKSRSGPYRALALLVALALAAPAQAVAVPTTSTATTASTPLEPSPVTKRRLTPTELQFYTAYVNWRAHAKILQGSLDRQKDLVGHREERIADLKTRIGELNREIAGQNHLNQVLEKVADYRPDPKPKEVTPDWLWPVVSLVFVGAAAGGVAAGFALGNKRASTP